LKCIEGRDKNCLEKIDTKKKRNIFEMIQAGIRGDYSDLKYSILGTEKSYYSPHGTNLVLFYT